MLILVVRNTYWESYDALSKGNFSLHPFSHLSIVLRGFSRDIFVLLVKMEEFHNGEKGNKFSIKKIASHSNFCLKMTLDETCR